MRSAQSRNIFLCLLLSRMRMRSGQSRSDWHWWVGGTCSFVKKPWWGMSDENYSFQWSTIILSFFVILTISQNAVPCWFSVHFCVCSLANGATVFPLKSNGFFRHDVTCFLLFDEIILPLMASWTPVTRTAYPLYHNDSSYWCFVCFEKLPPLTFVLARCYHHVLCDMLCVVPSKWTLRKSVNYTIWSFKLQSYIFLWNCPTNQHLCL